MQNSKYVSHSPIDEHLKRAEPRTVSFPPFRGIGPPTHLLGVGRGNLTSGGGEIVKTKVGKSISGISIDACSGDSGGPLLKWSDALDTFVLHATLNGGGYDCILNTTDGDGVWNSVFPHIKWIDNFVKGEQICSTSRI